MNIVKHPDSLDFYAVDGEIILGPFETQEAAREGWALAYPPPPPLPPQHLACCASCGSLDVEITSWVRANNTSMTDDGESPTNEAYCGDGCDETDLANRAFRVGDEVAWKMAPETYHFGVAISVEYEVWESSGHMVRIKTKDKHRGYFGTIDGLLPKGCVPLVQLVTEKS